MEENGIWIEDYKINAFLVGVNRKATLPTICNFLQDIAGNHANYRKVGFYDMQAENRFWVLNRMRVDMLEFPEWQDTITVKTWVSLMKGPFSYRHFEILKEGNRIGSASTLWISLDATKRRPTKVDWKNLPILPKKPSICGDAGKIRTFEENGLVPFDYKVQYSDLDMIEHVNNVKYLEWVLNSYESLPQSKSPSFLEVNYLNETHLGNTVSIFSKKEESSYTHSIKLENGKDAARMLIKWR